MARALISNLIVSFCQPLHTTNSSVPIYHRKERGDGREKKKEPPSTPIMKNWCGCFLSPTLSTVLAPHHLAIESLATAGLQRHSPCYCLQCSCKDSFDPSDFLLGRIDGFTILLILAVYISAPITYVHSHTRMAIPSLALSLLLPHIAQGRPRGLAVRRLHM